MNPLEESAKSLRTAAKRARLDTWMTFNGHLAPAVVGTMLLAMDEDQLDDVLDFCGQLQHIIDQGVDVELRVVPPEPEQG